MEYDDGAIERAPAYATCRDFVDGLQALRVSRMGTMLRWEEEKSSARELVLLIFPEAEFVLSWTWPGRPI